MSRFSCHQMGDSEPSQDVLEMKNAQILLWQKRYEEASNQTYQIKMELAAAKAYIDSLPTKQEVTYLKNKLSTLEDEKLQLCKAYGKMKKKNMKLINDMLKFKKEVIDLQSKFESQVSEAETLRSIISLWETRRKAAKQAGHLTVEEILVEKMKTEDQFEELLKVASCREQHFKAKIDSMKMKVEDCERAEMEAKQCGIKLREKVDLLQRQIEEKVKEVDYMFTLQAENNATIQKLEEKIKHLEAREKLRLSSQSKIQHCLRTIAKCKIATEGILSFIRSAVDGEFKDPTLIFPPDDEPLVHLSNSEKIINEEDIEILAMLRAEEVDKLKKEIELCQKSLVDRYICQLSSEVSNNCHLQ